MPDKPAVLRCAIYTRKSTEEGLKQAFNSLDAQRESGEAYIASQRSNGWVALPDRYDDGGFTGGNMDRPALKRLLADVEARKVDCIVVYKVDRFSRSLMDFARLIESLDRNLVSFVSVTQHFDTTSSMGRLTLNILLSFAQFEREIISERTRDKIAATRRKGKWSGGMPILGFDISGGRLAVNEPEAKAVRKVFDLYLEHESLLDTLKALDGCGLKGKHWVTKEGIERGGNVFSKSQLATLLQNVLYVGKVRLKNEVFPGEQPAIVEPRVFQRVQAILNRNALTRGSNARNQFGAILKGLLRCSPCGCAMIHTHTLKSKNRRYRYYVCTNAQKRGWQNCPTKSVPAQEIERFVIEQIRGIVKDPALVKETLQAARKQALSRIEELEGERAGIEKDIARANTEIRKIAGEVVRNPAAADRMADLVGQAQALGKKAADADAEVASTRAGMAGDKEAIQSLENFEPVWDALSPKEQARLVSTLVERVEYDGAKGTVSVTFHPSGLQALVGQTKRKEEAA